MKTALYKCTGYQPEKCLTRYRLETVRGSSTEHFCPSCNKVRSFLRIRGTTKDGVHLIFMPLHNARLTVDENISELDLRHAEPLFFARPFGKRETYTVHRGFVIVRHTVRHSNDDTHRCTVVYAFGKWGRQPAGTYHITSDCTGIAQAKRLIDDILKVNHWDRKA